MWYICAAAGKHAFRKPLALLQSMLLAQLRKDPTNAWVDISTRLKKAVQVRSADSAQVIAQLAIFRPCRPAGIYTDVE